MLNEGKPFRTIKPSSLGHWPIVRICQADTRLSPCVGKRVLLGYLRDSPDRGSLGLIQDVAGYWPLRLQDSPEHPETTRRYREIWKRNERVLFAYAGGLSGAREFSRFYL